MYLYDVFLVSGKYVPVWKEKETDTWKEYIEKNKRVQFKTWKEAYQFNLKQQIGE